MRRHTIFIFTIYDSNSLDNNKEIPNTLNLL